MTDLNIAMTILSILRVSASGWLESPYTSLEENCLVWSLSSRREGWVGSSCCNNIGYICQA